MRRETPGYKKVARPTFFLGRGPQKIFCAPNLKPINRMPINGNGKKLTSSPPQTYQIDLKPLSMLESPLLA